MFSVQCGFHTFALLTHKRVIRSLLVHGPGTAGAIQRYGGGQWRHKSEERGEGVRKWFLLTSVDKSPRGAFAELLGLVGQRDFHNARDVPRGSLDPDGVRSYQLGWG